MGVAVRTANAGDAEAVLALIQALADYERLEGPDEAARERLRTGLFDGRLGMLTLVAEVEGEIAGYAVAYEQYSTFEGLPKFYLEDIFVGEDHRGTGAGAALFRAVAQEALRRGCFAMEWEVLTWNRLALGFYERHGAVRGEGWYTYRLEGETLKRVAG